MSSSVAGSCLGGLFTPATQVFVVFFLRRSLEYMVSMVSMGRMVSMWPCAAVYVVVCSRLWWYVAVCSCVCSGVQPCAAVCSRVAVFMVCRNYCDA